MDLKKILILSSVIVLGLFVIYFVFYRGVLEIEVSPRPFVVKIDDTEYKETDSLKKYLAPGDYQVEISKQGFETYTSEVHVSLWSRTKLVPELWFANRDAEKVANLKAFYPSSSDDMLFYLNSEDNYLYRLNIKTTEKKAISKEPLIDLANVVWSPNHERAIIIGNAPGEEEESNEPLNNSAFLYALSSGERTALPNALASYCWSPKGDSMAYTLYENGKYNLYTVSAKGGDKRLITSLDTGQGGIAWVEGDKIILSNYVFEDKASNVFSINLKDKRVVNITGAGNAQGTIISNDHKLGAYLGTEGGDAPLINIIDLESNTSRETNFIATSLLDLLWTPDTNSLIKKEDLGDFGVRLSRLDLSSDGESSFYASDRLAVRSFFISSDKKNLFFITEDSLYKLKLKN